MTAPDPDDHAAPDPTENARRASRFKFAQNRIKRIAAGTPPLTDEQLEDLAQLLLTGGGADAA